MPTRTLALVLLLLSGSASLAADPDPLQLESKIPLGKVYGRIDHLALDPERQRLFVAQLGNDSIGVVDLKSGEAAQGIAGLKEPQGVGYSRTADMLLVANAGDGSVRLFRGGDLSPAGTLKLGDDADNIRIEPSGRAVVGYGGGALAVVDPAGGGVTTTIPLKSHPEGFQLDPEGPLAYVNLPESGQIAVVDRQAGRQVGAWPTGSAAANFPMALDLKRGQVLSVFRRPARLMAFRMQDGKVAARIDTCGDSDDVFVDAKRDRIYVSCGDGHIDVFAPSPAGYDHLARIGTASGARTSLFVPELDRLFLAVRSSSGQPAAVWVYRPAP